MLIGCVGVSLSTYEGRADGAGFEEIGMIADFPQLHEDVHHAHVVGT